MINSFYIRYLTLLILCLLLSFASLVLGQAREPAETINISSGEWPPHISSQIAGGGWLSQLVSEAFELEGVKVEYQYYPWPRSLQLAESGEVSGTIGWVHTVEREQLFWYSLPLSENRDVFLHLDSFDFDWHSIGDLHGLKIGAIDGFVYGEELEAARDKGLITVIVSKSDQQNVSLLLDRKIDLAIGEEAVLQRIIKRLLRSDEMAAITQHPRPLREQPVYLLIGRKTMGAEKLVGRFNRSLEILKANGRFEELQSTVN